MPENIMDHLWPDLEYPNLIITFLGGCNVDILTEEVKESVNDFITSVSKMNISFLTITP